MSINVDADNKSIKIDLEQQQISKLVRESSRQNKIGVFVPSKKVTLSPEEQEKSRRIEELTRLQLSRKEQEVEQSKKIQKLISDLQPEINEILKNNAEQRKEEIKAARERNRQEQQREIDRENDENRRRMRKYYKDALKNLPAKARLTDYTAYNNGFRPIIRK